MQTRLLLRVAECQTRRLLHEVARKAPLVLQAANCRTRLFLQAADHHTNFLLRVVRVPSDYLLRQTNSYATADTFVTVVDVLIRSIVNWVRLHTLFAEAIRNLLVEERGCGRPRIIEQFGKVSFTPRLQFFD